MKRLSLLALLILGISHNTYSAEKNTYPIEADNLEIKVEEGMGFVLPMIQSLNPNDIKKNSYYLIPETIGEFRVSLSDPKLPGRCFDYKLNEKRILKLKQEIESHNRAIEELKPKITMLQEEIVIKAKLGDPREIQRLVRQLNRLQDDLTYEIETWIRLEQEVDLVRDDNKKFKKSTSSVGAYLFSGFHNASKKLKELNADSKIEVSEVRTLTFYGIDFGLSELGNNEFELTLRLPQQCELLNGNEIEIELEHVYELAKPSDLNPNKYLPKYGTYIQKGKLVRAH